MATLGGSTQEEKKKNQTISNHFYKAGTAFFSFTGGAESPRCSSSSWHRAVPSTKCMAHLLPLLELPAHANSPKCIQIIP